MLARHNPLPTPGWRNSFEKRLVAGATKAIRWTKTAVNIGLKQIAHSVMDASISYEMLTFATNDHREAVAAFQEKRNPTFHGT
jgi:enoyl-CoA hydratase